MLQFNEKLNKNYTDPNKSVACIMKPNKYYIILPI